MLDIRLLYTPKLHKWISDKKTYLGFVSVNVFERVEENFEILESIKNGLLNDHHFSRELEDVSEKTEFYGSIDLEKLEERDFTSCNDKLLDECYLKYWSDENWGADLEVFKKHKTMVDQYLMEINFQSDQHFFLCQEWLSKDKNVNLNFFAYLVCVISISLNRIAVITYGGD